MRLNERLMLSNLIRLSRGDEIEIVIQRLRFNGLESVTHILLMTLTMRAESSSLGGVDFIACCSQM